MCAIFGFVNYGKKINYKKFYRYALSYYDRDHFQEV